MSLSDSKELDLLLSDVKQLLKEDVPAVSAGQQPVRQQSGTVSDETRLYTPVREAADGSQPGAYDGQGQYEWNMPGYTGTYDGGAGAQVVRRSAAAAASASAFGMPAEPGSRRRPVPARQQTAAQAPETVRERRPQAKAGPEPAKVSWGRAEQPPEPRRTSTKAQRAARQVLEDDEEEYEEYPIKKSHKGRNFLIILILLALIAFGVYSLLAKQPVRDDPSMGARKPGVSTILLAGTDEDGTRTDTLMLMTLDTGEHTASLVSIPRDTLVNGSYQVPKINGVYGINGGGQEGIEMLMQRVSECIGFQPDGYMLVNLDSFVELVDIMGGVEFDVPMDMYYNDPAQDLYISLSAGLQKLDGEQAMGLVRFRSGYEAADLERVNVQRSFVSAAADQWMSPKLLLKAPRLLSWFGKHVDTDLSVGNMTWIAMALMRADASAITAETLPGSPAWISGGSYYVLNPYNVAELVNRCCNPYEREITVDDLFIRN